MSASFLSWDSTWIQSLSAATDPTAAACRALRLSKNAGCMVLMRLEADEGKLK
jgi:hypothetical protein